MNPFTKIISASLSPNTEADDVAMAWRVLITPWTWKRGSAISGVKRWFSDRFPGYSVQPFNSGRAAMSAILAAFGITRGDEVIIQAFTCVAVPNSVLWCGAVPVYADIDASLNIDLADAKKKLTKRTKALVVQHTLGLPADMDAVRAFAKKYDLLVIEDCAHALGAEYKGKPLGSCGDAAFFSFGRDKVLSSVFGGMAIVRSDHGMAVKKLGSAVSDLPIPRGRWILQQVLHPIVFSAVLPLYVSGIGKALLFGFQKMGLLSFPVYPEEKRAKRPADFPAAYPNALARLLLVQMPKLTRFNRHRQAVAAYYAVTLKQSKNATLLTYPAGSIFLRFPVLVPDPQRIVKNSKQQGILLGNWYHNTIDPDGVDFAAVNYVPGSCPNAETVAVSILNLPTNISLSEAKRVAACVV